MNSLGSAAAAVDRTRRNWLTLAWRKFEENDDPQQFGGAWIVAALNEGVSSSNISLQTISSVIRYGEWQGQVPDARFFRRSSCWKAVPVCGYISMALRDIVFGLNKDMWRQYWMIAADATEFRMSEAAYNSSIRGFHYESCVIARFVLEHGLKHHQVVEFDGPYPEADALRAWIRQSGQALLLRPKNWAHRYVDFVFRTMVGSEVVVLAAQVTPQKINKHQQTYKFYSRSLNTSGIAGCERFTYTGERASHCLLWFGESEQVRVERISAMTLCKSESRVLFSEKYCMSCPLSADLAYKLSYEPIPTNELICTSGSLNSKQTATNNLTRGSNSGVDVSVAPGLPQAADLIESAVTNLRELIPRTRSKASASVQDQVNSVIIGQPFANAGAGKGKSDKVKSGKGRPNNKSVGKVGGMTKSAVKREEKTMMLSSVDVLFAR
jgi:hypothetical protein